MLPSHVKGLLITASGILIISPDGLLTRLIETDHWNMIFWRSLLLSFGMWLLIVIISIVSKIVPVEVSASPVLPTQGVDPAHIAAISAAVHQYRKNR